jgi:hypothetical protein
LKIDQESSLAVVPLIRPTIEAAIQRCRDQADVKVNLPWAFFRMGEFQLLLGRLHESLGAYARAIQLSTAAYMIDEALEFPQRLLRLEDRLPGLDWVRQFLLLGRSVKFQGGALDNDLVPLASKPEELFQAKPIVIVAGGCDAEVKERIKSYRPLLIDAFRDFHGTILCGGTREGISGIVGELTKKHNGQIRSIAYLPKHIPNDATQDRRYTRFLTTQGEKFSPLEPLQNWIDLMAAGVAPSQVKLLGINGGHIAAFEYRLALSLGATVGIFRDSGREAGRLGWDTDWQNAPNLILLPQDLQTLRMFVAPPPCLDALPKEREIMGRKCHEMYRAEKLKSVSKEYTSLLNWKELPESFRESSRQLADHIGAKLAAIGRKADRVKRRKIVLAKFTSEEVERMAEMEHGRWNLERLLDGWKLGSKDTAKKLSPFLVPWKELNEEMKDYDRKFVRGIPEILKAIGMEVRPIDEAG